MKNISIIGVGKLGLCLSLNLEAIGYNIIGIDASNDYINSLKEKTLITNEPYVTELLKNSKNIKFTIDLKQSLNNDIIFIVVNTPSTPDWKYDHKNIDDVIEQLISFGKQSIRKDIIINCTTFPGYCESLNKKLNSYNYYVSYNPEFIAQGSIIKDQLYCDSVLIGQYDEYIGNIIESIYKDMCKSNPTINRMTLTEAELVKLSVNCFLTTKISFANMIGDISKKINCNPTIVLNAIGADSRIGNKYLKHGFGFGGPCFPRDNRALAKCAEEVGINAIISKSTDEMNSLHLDYQIEDFIKSNPNKNIPIEIDSITYKVNSDIIEESQQLKFAIRLSDIGYSVIIKEIDTVIKKLKSSYGNKFTYIIR